LASRARHTDIVMATTIAMKPPDAAMIAPRTKIAGA
jgi:hypothetical protein